MDIKKGIQIVDLGIFLQKHKALIISDLHLGYEDAMIKRGALVPKFALKDTLKRLDSILEKIEVDQVILNGDLKHEFGRISKQEWSDTLKLLDYLLKKVKTVTIIKGNHDPSLAPIADKRGLKITPAVILDDILVIHGDKPPKAISPQIKTIIIGHTHPAVRLREGYRNELFKCFLLGTYQKRNLIIQPSFHQLHEGHDILKQDDNPFLTSDMPNWKVWIVADEVYEFGRVKDIPTQ